MSNHTPTPWQRDGSHIYGPDPLRRIVAQVHYAGRGYQEEDADNGHLLLAAPDLLEALKDQAAWIRNRLSQGPIETRGQGLYGPHHPSGYAAVLVPDWEMKQKLDSIEQDIAKAEGRS